MRWMGVVRRIRVVCWLLLLCPLLGRASELDALQRAWLAEHPQLRVGVVLQAPYAEYQRRQQQLGGLNVELTETLATSLGVTLSWRSFETQAALEQALRDGRIDFAPGQVQTPAGLRLWRYSDPYLRIPHLLVGERLGEVRVELERLGEREPIAVRVPSMVADYLRSNYSNLHLQPQPSARQALQAVVEQRARYAVVDQAQLSRLSPGERLLTPGDHCRRRPAAAAALRYPARLAAAGRHSRHRPAPVAGRAAGAAAAALADGEEAGPRRIPPFWRSLSILLGLLLAVCILLLSVLRRQRGRLEKRLLEARQTLAQREVAEEALRLAQFSSTTARWASSGSTGTAACATPTRRSPRCSATPRRPWSTGLCRSSSRPSAWTAG